MCSMPSFLGLCGISVVAALYDCGIFFVLILRWMLKIILKYSLLPIIYPFPSLQTYFPHQTARAVPEVFHMGVGGEWNFLLSPPLPSYSPPGNEGN